MKNLQLAPKKFFASVSTGEEKPFDFFRTLFGTFESNTVYLLLLLFLKLSVIYCVPAPHKSLWLSIFLFSNSHSSKPFGLVIHSLQSEEGIWHLKLLRF